MKLNIEKLGWNVLLASTLAISAAGAFGEDNRSVHEINAEIEFIADQLRNCKYYYKGLDTKVNETSCRWVFDNKDNWLDTCKVAGGMKDISNATFRYLEQIVEDSTYIISANKKATQ